MFRLLLLLSGIFLIGFFYSYIIQKFFKSKTITFIPSLIGAIWFAYSLITLNTKNTTGFEDIVIVLIALMVGSLIMGNILGWKYFKRKDE